MNQRQRQTIDLVVQHDQPPADAQRVVDRYAALARAEGHCRILLCGLGQAASSPGPEVSLHADFAAAMAQSRGDIVAILTPGASPLAGGCELLRQSFATGRVHAVLGWASRRSADDDPLAELADIDARHVADGLRLRQVPPPNPACAAFLAEDLRTAMGPARRPSCTAADCFALACRLRAMGRTVVFEPDWRADLTPPAGWAEMLKEQWRLGRLTFRGLVALRGHGLADWPWPKGWAWQVVDALAVVGVLAAMAPTRPTDGAVCAAIGLLLLYPLNRGFLKLTAETRPGLINQALLFCLLRPFAWAAGMVQGGFGRLAGKN